MKSLNITKQQIKKLLAGKKSKMTIYVIVVLWIAVFMQIGVNTIFHTEGNLLDAFVSTNSDVSSYELEMTATYGTKYLSESDKKELIRYIANKIGLQIDNNIVINNDKNSEAYYEKTSKNANTLIKLISMEKENDSGKKEITHYLKVNLTLYKDMDSILDYRDLLKGVYNELKTTEIQTTMQLSATYKGKLALNEMNNIADGMIDKLDGEIAYENRKQNSFTIYAYSGLLDEYVISAGTKINIHVAMNYDKNNDVTNVYLGTPVIHGGY